jgi:hypothetical protein
LGMVVSAAWGITALVIGRRYQSIVDSREDEWAEATVR